MIVYAIKNMPMKKLIKSKERKTVVGRLLFETI